MLQEEHPPGKDQEFGYVKFEGPGRQKEKILRGQSNI